MGRADTLPTTALFANLPGMVYRCRNDRDWTMEFASEGCRTLTGYSPEDLIDNRTIAYARLIHPEDRERVWADVQAALGRGEAFRLEYRLLSRDGGQRWVWGQGGGILSPAGALIGLEGFVMDITERRRAGKDLQIDLALQRLRNVILQMQREEDWEQVIRLFHEELKKWVAFNACSINIVGEDGTLTAYAVGPRRGVHKNVRESMAPALQAALKTAMETGRPLYRRNRRDPLFAPRLPREVNAVVDMPFLGGTVAVNSTREDAFTEQDLEILERFAQVISQGYRRLEDLRALAESEGRFRQAQKLEAVGQLAGGVAHDFNNLLTIIGGHCELLLQGGQTAALAQAEIEGIYQAVQRGGTLVRQLLAFSRRQVLNPEVLSLNALVADLEKMLRRLLGEDVQLHLQLTPSPLQVLADEGQLQQVLLNLAANARDAMPGGGRLTVETAGVELGEEHVCGGVAVQAGPYARLVVRDTGIGMDESTRSHVFEPFFTTKAPGEGTGLGLSTVYGIVKQSQGYIWISSEPGEGTSVEIYLPRVPETVQASSRPAVVSRPSSMGTETILVVEDDADLRLVVCRFLEQWGYTVLAAAAGREALGLAGQHPGTIHLLLTDVVMPEMNGRDLAEALVAARPETRVVYMSGYAQGVIDRHGALKPGTAFLQKPFTLSALAQKVREVLA